MLLEVKEASWQVVARTTEAVFDATGATLRAMYREDTLGWLRSRGLCAT